MAAAESSATRPAAREPATQPTSSPLELATTVFDVSRFENLEYAQAFSGRVGSTEVWPGEMGWQGERIDLQFRAPQDIPASAVEYRLRIHIARQFEQPVELAVLAGAERSHLQLVQVKRLAGPGQIVVRIPLRQFTVGRDNWIRLQGRGVRVGAGQPAGIRWDLWRLALIRTASPDEVRRDQLARLTQYIFDAVQPNGLVRDALPLSPTEAPIHPATPDAAGFALVGLCAADYFGLTEEAASTVERILRAYAGRTPGVKPDRSADGHWTHFMNVADGSWAGSHWERVYTPIGSALLVAGARFARNHFAGRPAIAELADALTASTNFNAAIHPSGDGRLYLAMSKDGGGDERRGCTRPWNEFMLVVSLARREADNARALAVAPVWLNAAGIPKSRYRDYDLPTDRPGHFAPAFWMQQGRFLNADVANDPGFERLFSAQRAADAQFCAAELAADWRYGLTAGVSPRGYTVDAIQAAQDIFSPEAVMAWGDLATCLRFYREQDPDDPSGRYGLRRVSRADAAWVPQNAGLVDHLFLMFGLTESIDPQFFKTRLVEARLSPQP